MLHRRLHDAGEVAELAARFRTAGSLRVEPFLAEAFASRLAEALTAQPFTFKSPRADLRYLYLEHAFVPEPGCEHVTCATGHWLWSEGAAFASRVAGITVAPPADRRVIATLYTRGCYLDPHNDTDGARSLAFVLGLTRDTWPAERGGHLEFLEAAGDQVRVRERRAPGWNTLDLFDVRNRNHIHRVPLVLDPVIRLNVSGWFY